MTNNTKLSSLRHVMRLAYQALVQEKLLFLSLFLFLASPLLSKLVQKAALSPQKGDTRSSFKYDMD